ncbi:hypothetical protein RLPCCGM1_c4071 [Rhizobium leguminosarum bv. phaseoli CCGM1]|nr:hypothetical protein RLPCCGM1_c4071 [Rhizobium leguminosarum bv. phaseoli CCGM1]
MTCGLTGTPRSRRHPCVAFNDGAALLIAYSGQIAEDPQQQEVKATLPAKV